MTSDRYKAGGFTNASIRIPIKGKPHICKRDGRWRVSASTKPHWKVARLHRLAHDFARRLL